MKLNHFICPICGHDFYAEAACVRCDACGCNFYASQSKTSRFPFYNKYPSVQPIQIVETVY
jgi:hypothetical protein